MSRPSGLDGESIGIVFEPAIQFDSPRLKTELVEWTQTNPENRDLRELIVIAVFVAVFL